MRYVVLQFEDNEVADEFVTMGLHTSDPSAYEIMAMYAVPTKFCECPPSDDGKAGRLVAKGEKFGWWVHRVCGLAISGNFQSPNNLLLQEPLRLLEKFVSPIPWPTWRFVPNKDSKTS